MATGLQATAPLGSTCVDGRPRPYRPTVIAGPQRSTASGLSRREARPAPACRYWRGFRGRRDRGRWRSISIALLPLIVQPYRPYTCPVMSGPAMLCYAMPCHAILYCIPPAILQGVSFSLRKRSFGGKQLKEGSKLLLYSVQPTRTGVDGPTVRHSQCDLCSVDRAHRYDQSIHLPALLSPVPWRLQDSQQS
ncbi:hypothetical protein BO94DRAFT_30703 [Aspergillus sclerotioniger CBS 115572]|uniref:Uncharacterized protein n=1 Tax=Aspergillus sclerotioniger CBS 115572 TaxID=1450535 RepID=A0A317X0T3_9EURO|nr:hypothetical protein BO94DRAFT_30703 [Aspergillus sclerotioniger CBS 115572]PWY90568.1 hypothetical protein BO94DRAFT_30703 [Aspergillus sclerotioniger CBS 115572]